MNKKQCLLILSKKQYAEFVIKGQSFRYNQWCNNGNFENTNNWYVYNGTLSVSNNVGKYTITTHVSWNAIEQSITVVLGHKYFISFNIKASRNTKCYITLGDIFWTQYNVGTTETKINVIVTPTTDEKPFMINVNPSDIYLQNGDYVELSNIMIIDLNDLGLNGIGNVSDFFNTDIGKAIQSDFYIPYSQNCAIYNATTPLKFNYGTFTPRTNFQLRGIENAQDLYNTKSGIITRKIGVIDLGTLTWNYNSNNGSFNNGFGNYPDVKPVTYGQTPKLICNKYLTVVTKYGNDDLTSLPDKSITLWTTLKTIIIKDTSYNDANDLKASLNGILLYYELENTTTEQMENVALNVDTNKCYDNNGLELEIV